MSTTAPAMPRSRRALPTPAAAALAVVVASVASIVVSVVIAAVAHGAGSPHGFKALKPATFAPLIVFGLVFAVIAWVLIRSKAADPRRLLTLLAPTVVVLSLIPDIAVGASKSLTDTTWGGIVALMLMHLVVSAAGVASFAYFLPLPDTRR